MCEAYPTKPKRVRRPRVVMELSPESAQALRDYAVRHNVMIRDAALDMVRLMDNREALLFETDDALKDAQDKLAASEEARLLAEKVAFDNAENLWKAQQDAALWQSRAEQISQDGAAEVNDLSRRLTEALDKADQWEQQCRAAQSDATLVRAALKGWSDMSAWDHVRAAVWKRPFVMGCLWGLPAGCIVLVAAVRGMI